MNSNYCIKTPNSVSTNVKLKLIEDKLRSDLAPRNFELLNKLQEINNDTLFYGFNTESGDLEKVTYADIYLKVEEELKNTVFIPATNETLGGIKVGNNLKITKDGTLSAYPQIRVIENITLIPGSNDQNFTISQADFKKLSNPNLVMLFVNIKGSSENIYLSKVSNASASEGYLFSAPRIYNLNSKKTANILMLEFSNNLTAVLSNFEIDLEYTLAQTENTLSLQQNGSIQGNAINLKTIGGQTIFGTGDIPLSTLTEERVQELIDGSINSLLDENY